MAEPLSVELTTSLPGVAFATLVAAIMIERDRPGKALGAEALYVIAQGKCEM